MNDEFYRCARTSSHLKHEQLHKHLDIDFRKSITKLRDTLNKCKSPNQRPQDSSNKSQGNQSEPNTDSSNIEKETTELTNMLTDFMNKYGTHVILECSHGYRKLQTEERTITKVDQLRNFKVGLDAKFMSVTGFEAEKENETGIEESSKVYLDGTYYVGSPKALRKALNENYQQPLWRKKISEEGDVDVISHDKTMSIADLLLHAYISNEQKAPDDKQKQNNADKVDQKVPDDKQKHDIVEKVEEKVEQKVLDDKQKQKVKEDWKQLSKLYRFWTNVHIQDLQQGKLRTNAIAICLLQSCSN